MYLIKLKSKLIIVIYELIVCVYTLFTNQFEFKSNGFFILIKANLFFLRKIINMSNLFCAYKLLRTEQLNAILVPTFLFYRVIKKKFNFSIKYKSKIKYFKIKTLKFFYILINILFYPEEFTCFCFFIET